MLCHITYVQQVIATVKLNSDYVDDLYRKFRCRPKLVCKDDIKGTFEVTGCERVAHLALTISIDQQRELGDRSGMVHGATIVHAASVHDDGRRLYRAAPRLSIRGDKPAAAGSDNAAVPPLVRARLAGAHRGGALVQMHDLYLFSHLCHSRSHLPCV